MRFIRLLADPITHGLCWTFQAKIAQITNELYTTRHALVNKICNQCVHQNAVVNLPEKQVVSDDDVRKMIEFSERVVSIKKHKRSYIA